MTEVPSKSTASGSKKYDTYFQRYGGRVFSSCMCCPSSGMQHFGLYFFLQLLLRLVAIPDCVVINKPELIRVIIHVGNPTRNLPFGDRFKPTHENGDFGHVYIKCLLRGIWADGSANSWAVRPAIFFFHLDWGAPCCRNRETLLPPWKWHSIPKGDKCLGRVTPSAFLRPNGRLRQFADPKIRPWPDLDGGYHGEPESSTIISSRVGMWWKTATKKHRTLLFAGSITWLYQNLVPFWLTQSQCWIWL